MHILINYLIFLYTFNKILIWVTLKTTSRLKTNKINKESLKIKRKCLFLLIINVYYIER